MTISLKAGSGSSPWYTIDAPSQAEEREALLLFAGLTEESEVLDRGKIGNAHVRTVICPYVSERVCQCAVSLAVFYDAS